MPVIHPSLFLIIKRFPEHKEIIQRLYWKNENFREACEDHQKCADAMKYWDQSESEEAPARREELVALLRELEEEIEQDLQELRV